MNPITNGKQAAFSCAGSEDRTLGDMPDGNYYNEPEFGLTKREHFAGLALQGMVTPLGDNLALSDDDAKFIADKAVRFADALLAALAEPMRGGTE